MPNIRSIDMRLVEELFDMGGGYVLEFSNRSMSEFFAQELNVDIDDPAYQDLGTSKAKRLRCFLNKVDQATAVRTLQALWDYREATRKREWAENAEGRFLQLINRVRGGPQHPAQRTESPKPAFDRPRINLLKQQLIELSTLAPQPRGYAFEKWLVNLFDLFKLDAREPFRNRGEQIDGSFMLDGQTYLLEAKWQAGRTAAGELHAFHGKVEQKAAWTRGLFISNSGFTEDGLIAFGRGKRVICMDGFDLFETLDRELPLDQVLIRKARRAAETGSPFERVRDLFAR